MAKTKKSKRSSRRSSRRSGSRVLTVDSKSKIPALEKMLKSGKITVVLVFADWCPHCHTFRENIWNPMCSGPAKHNRVAVRDDMVRNSSLANAKFNYLPSVLVVNEKGQVEDFKNESGETTNAMPTPKSLNEMNRVVNLNVSPNNQIQDENSNENNNMNNSMNNSVSENNNFGKRYNSPMTTQDIVTLSSSKTPMTPNGKSYTPAEVEELEEANLPEISSPEMSSPEISSSETSTFSRTPTPYPQKGGGFGTNGGALLSSLQEVSQGILPVAFLGSLSMVLKGGRRRKSTRRIRGKRRSTRRRRMIRA